jgi:hypothetical protein
VSGCEVTGTAKTSAQLIVKDNLRGERNIGAPVGDNVRCLGGYFEPELQRLMILGQDLIEFLEQFPGVLEVSVVGENCGEIWVETASPDDADTVRAALTIIECDVVVIGSRVFIS